MKTAIAALLMLFAVAARADDLLHIGLGVSQSETMGSGVWYEDGAQYPHTLGMTSPAAEIGIDGDLITRGKWGVRWHSDFMHVTSVNTNALVDSDDDNYDQATQSCKSPCAPSLRMVGHGSVNGVSFTIEPYRTVDGFQIGIEAGPFLYVPTWTTTETDTANPLTFVHKASLQIGAIGGIRITRGNWSVRYAYVMDRSRGDQTPAIWKSTQILMVDYKF